MVSQIRPAQFSEWIKKNSPTGNPIVLDVREPLEIQTASIKAADFDLLCIPMGSIPSKIQELPTDRAIACLCHHGSRSMQVAQYLHQNGFQNVVNISGGIHLWAQELDVSIPNY